MNFKPFLSIGIACILLFASSCNQQSNNQTQVNNNSDVPTQLKEINVCYSGSSGTQIVVWYAQEKGLFKKYGLNSKLIAVKGGSTATIAMVSGEMDFCQIAGPAVVTAVVAEQDLAIIAGLFNTYVTSLITNSEIQTPEDLKGKALAISKPGGASDVELRVILKELNLKPDDEVPILAVGGQGERLAAMETKQIAGTILSPPMTTIAKQKGYREFLKMSSLNKPYQHTALVSTRKYIEENPETVENFLKAIIESIAMMKQDQSGTVEVLKKYLLLDEESNDGINVEEALNESYEVLVKEVLPDIPYPNLEGIQTILNRLEAENPNAKNFKPSDVVHTTTLEKLENEGFIPNQ